MKESWKESEDREEVKLRHTEHFRRMEIVPMPELMSCRLPVRIREGFCKKGGDLTKDGFNFLWLALFDECVKYDDMFALE